MDYRNTETKLDQLVGYFNEEKINLSPIFQRGRVWTLRMRQELIKNIVRRRPIPAIFLYKDEAGSKYTYAILDGKQRLESILMFIGSANKELAIRTWGKYIFGPHKRNVGFAIDLKDGRKSVKFSKFTEREIRDLREYPIPTVEIALNENTQLDEIISLFVDINQYGAKVTRVNIVRAIKRKDPLLNDVYALVAEKQNRSLDTFTRRKKTPFAQVLKKLQVISCVSDPDVQADRMWEKMFEFALFVRSNGAHRKPTEILKTFIKTSKEEEKKLSKAERARLTAVFNFLREAYTKCDLGTTRLATEYSHFYIMVTTLLDADKMTIDTPYIVRKLEAFGKLIGKDSTNDTYVNQYIELSSKQTTDTAKRKERTNLFIKVLEYL